MREVFLKNLTNLSKNSKTILLTADVGFKILDDFKKNNPSKFFNVGISEQNMIGIATGLSLCGNKVFCYSIANFAALRAIEHIRNGPCYHNLDVIIVSGGSGYSYGPLGYSHHAIEDLAIMRSLPNIEIFSPMDDYEIEVITKYLIKRHKGPAYLRIDKSKLENKSSSLITSLDTPRKIIKHSKSRIVIFATGGIINEAIMAINYLKKINIYCDLYSVFNLTKINKKFIKSISQKRILTVEETIKENGLYNLIQEYFKNKNVKNISIDKNKIFTNAGSQFFIRKKQKISKRNIINQILKFDKK